MTFLSLNLSFRRGPSNHRRGRIFATGQPVASRPDVIVVVFWSLSPQTSSTPYTPLIAMGVFSWFSKVGAKALLICSFGYQPLRKLTTVGVKGI